MKVRWVDVLLQAVNFLVLVWILKHVLYGRVQEILARRKAEVATQLSAAAAEKQRAQAERVKAEAMTRIAGVESDKALEVVRAQAEVERTKLRESARREADEVLESGRKQLGEERDEAGRQLESAAARLSVSLAERSLGELDPEIVTRLLLARAVAHLEALEPARLETLRRELAVGSVTVATACSLDEPTRASTAKRIGNRLGIAPDRVELVVDAAIHGGAEIRLPSSAVTFTWHGAVERLAQEVVRS